MVFVTGTDGTGQVLGAPASDLYLRVVGSSRDGQVVRLAAAKCTIGSADGCTLRLRARGVRSVHCLILRGARGMVARAWAPHTRLNGREFRDCELVGGDRLSIGPIELAVLTEEEGRRAARERATSEGPPGVPARRSLADVRWARLRARRLVAEVRKLRGQLDAFARQAERPAGDVETRVDELAAEGERLVARQRELDERAAQCAEREAQLELCRQEWIGQSEALAATRRELDERRAAWEAERAVMPDVAELAARAEELARREADVQRAADDSQALRGQLAAQQEACTAQAAEIERLRVELDAEFAEVKQRQSQLAADESQRAGERDELARMRLEIQRQAEVRQVELDDERRLLDGEQAALAAERQQLREQFDRLQADAASLQTEQSRHAEDVAQREAELQTGVAAAERLRGELEARANELNDRQASLAQAELDVRRQADELAGRQHTLAQDGAAQAAELEAQRASLAAARDALECEKQIVREQAQRLQDEAAARGEIERQRAELERLRDELAGQTAELELRRQQLDAEGVRLETERSELQQRLADGARDATCRAAAEIDGQASEVERAALTAERLSLDAQRRAWQAECQQAAAVRACLDGELADRDEAIGRLRGELAQRADAHVEAVRQLDQRDAALAECVAHIEQLKREAIMQSEQLSQRGDELERVRSQFEEHCQSRAAGLAQHELDSSQLSAARDEIDRLSGQVESLERRLVDEHEHRTRQRNDLEALRQQFEALKVRHARCPRVEGEEEEEPSGRNLNYEHESPSSLLTALFSDPGEVSADELARTRASDGEYDDDEYEDEDEEETVAEVVPATTPAPELRADDDAPIEDHIAAFLSRVRCATPPPPPPVEKPRRRKRKSDKLRAGDAPVPVIDMPAAPSELVRRSQPSVVTDLTAMRELANLQARHNIEAAGQKRDLSRSYGTVGTGIACFLMGFVAMFVLGGTLIRSGAALIVVVGIFFFVRGMLGAKQVYRRMQGKRPGLRAMLEEVEAEIAAARQEAEAAGTETADAEATVEIVAEASAATTTEAGDAATAEKT